MPLDFNRVRQRLRDFDFSKLFVEDLGWSQPPRRRDEAWECNGLEFTRKQVAELGGVVVFEVTADDGSIPDAKMRAAVHKEIAKLHHENLLIFLDAKRTQSLWYWVKREGDKSYPRDHPFVRGQPGDLFLSKLSSIVIELTDLDEQGNIGVVEVARRLQQALDVERVTKKFYREFDEQRIAFLELIDLPDERNRRWYASVLLNRLMFIYFLQRKGFLDRGRTRYLQEKLDDSKRTGPNRYFRHFLKSLFFEGFAKPADKRSDEARALLGDIRYLNGGLFLPHSIELIHTDLDVPDMAFENVFKLFEAYSWNLDDTPGGDDQEINPDVLGYIFEKYINQKAFGAYYTRTEITEYLCEQTIYRLVLDKVNTPGIPGVVAPRQFDSIAEFC